MPVRRRRHSFPIGQVFRASVATLLVVALVGVLAFCAAILLIDPNGYKKQIAAAVKQATGRDLGLRGPMSLEFGLPPWLIAEDVTLSNPGGLSRVDMATLERAEARIAVLPLLFGNINLTDLTLIRPNLLLERDVNGRGNWVFETGARVAPAAAPVAQSGGQAPPSVSPLALGQPIRARVAVQSIHIEDGRLGWRPRPDAETVELTVPQLDGSAGGPGGTMLLSGTLASAGRSLTLGGEVGSLDRLFDNTATVPWPVQMTLKDGGARLAVTGSIAQPMTGRGLAVQIDAAVTDFAGLAAFLPPDVPAPHDANATIHWGDGQVGSEVGLASVSLHLGGLKLPKLLPGVEITHADLSAPGLDRPVHADIEGNSSGIGALRFVVNAATLAAVLPGAHPDNPVPIDVTLDAGRALISAKGVIAEPTALKGVDLEVFVRVPDVAAFGPLIDRALPPLSQVAFEGQVFGDLTPTGAFGIRHGTLTLPEAQLSGDIDVRLGLRPSIHAVVSSQHIDLDSLFADLLAAKTAPPDLTGSLAAAEPPKPEPPPPLPVHAEASRWLIPDDPIDFSLLDRVDLDMQARVEQLQVGGVTYSQLNAGVLLRDGKLVVDPLIGMMPGGPAEAKFAVDSRVPDPPVSLYLRAPQFQLAQLAALFHDRYVATGTLYVDVDLQGAGRTPHAIAASLDGKFGLASNDSELDNRLLLPLLKLARLPEVPLSAAGTTKLRCLVLRLDATRGVANVSTMVVDLLRLVVTGGGSLDLGLEQFGLQLRPMLRLPGGAGTNIVVPVRVAGGFLDPRVAVDVGGKLGPALTGAATPPDACTAALAVMTAPPAAKPKPAAAPTPAPKQDAAGAAASRIDDVLKELINK